MKFSRLLLLTILLSTGCATEMAGRPAEQPAQKVSGQTSGQAAWLAQIGGGGPELVTDLVQTSDGRTCAAGTFWATVTFGEGDVAKTLSTDGTADIFVACYRNSDGTLTSVTQFGTHRNDEVRAIAAFPNGDVVITGFFARQFGAGASGKLKANNSADIFLTRLDRAGNEVWAKRFGGTGADVGAGLAVTRRGNILLTGSFTDSIDFAAGKHKGQLTSLGSSDALIVKLSGTGEAIWARRLGGTSYDQARRVVELPGGDIVVAGVFQGEATAEGAGQSLKSRGYDDVFVARLAGNDGDPLWLRELGGTRQDTIDGLAVDSSGRIHLTGFFQGDMTLGELSLEEIGSSDIYLARLSRNGNVEHAFRFGSEHTDMVMDLVADKGLLHYTGHYQGRTDFDVREGETIRSSARPGDANAYLLTMDEDYNLVEVRTMGGIGVEMGFAIASGQDGLALAGLFNKGFDPEITELSALSPRGKSDVFVLFLPSVGAN